MICKWLPVTVNAGKTFSWLICMGFLRKLKIIFYLHVPLKLQMISIMQRQMMTDKVNCISWQSSFCRLLYFLPHTQDKLSHLLYFAFLHCSHYVIFPLHPFLCSMYRTAYITASGLCCVGVSFSLSTHSGIIGNRRCKHPCHLKSNNVCVCLCACVLISAAFCITVVSSLSAIRRTN